MVDATGALAGVVTRDELSRPDLPDALGPLVIGQKIISVTAGTSIRDAARIMIRHDVRQVPVTDAAGSGALTGWLTLNDITRQQNAAEL